MFSSFIAYQIINNTEDIYHKFYISILSISLFSVISIFSVNSVVFYNFQSSTQTLSREGLVAMDVQAGFAPYS